MVQYKTDLMHDIDGAAQQKRGYPACTQICIICWGRHSSHAPTPTAGPVQPQLHWHLTLNGREQETGSAEERRGVAAPTEAGGWR
jgi:hypothetical protein